MDRREKKGAKTQTINYTKLMFCIIKGRVLGIPFGLPWFWTDFLIDGLIRL